MESIISQQRIFIDKVYEPRAEVLRGYLNLEKDWDNHGADEIGSITVCLADEFLYDITRKIFLHIRASGEDLGYPLIYPQGNGSILFEWNNRCRELLITIPMKGSKPFEILKINKLNMHDQEGVKLATTMVSLTLYVFEELRIMDNDCWVLESILKG